MLKAIENKLPQGLKPIDFIGFIGTTEVVPSQDRPVFGLVQRPSRRNNPRRFDPGVPRLSGRHLRFGVTPEAQCHPTANSAGSATQLLVPGSHRRVSQKPGPARSCLIHTSRPPSLHLQLTPKFL